MIRWCVRGGSSDGHGKHREVHFRVPTGISVRKSSKPDTIAIVTSQTAMKIIGLCDGKQSSNKSSLLWRKLRLKKSDLKVPVLPMMILLRRPASALKAIFLFWSIYFCCVSAADHTVGGENGWELSSDVKTWASSTLLFIIGGSFPSTKTTAKSSSSAAASPACSDNQVEGPGVNPSQRRSPPSPPAPENPTPPPSDDQPDTTEGQSRNEWSFTERGGVVDFMIGSLVYCYYWLFGGSCLSTT